LATNDVRRGEAAPRKNDDGDIITSLSAACFAVPVYGSTTMPLLTLFGSLIAPALLSLIMSSPIFVSSSSSFFLRSFSFSKSFLL